MFTLLFWLILFASGMYTENRWQPRIKKKNNEVVYSYKAKRKDTNPTTKTLFTI